MLIGGLWLLKFLGGVTDDILEVRPNPLRVNEWKPKNQSHTHKKCGKKGLVKWEVSKMKSTNMNQLSFFFFKKIKDWNFQSTDEKSKTVWLK